MKNKMIELIDRIIIKFKPTAVFEEPKKDNNIPFKLGRYGRCRHLEIR